MLATGRGALVVVAGEPGIGKSTLLDEFDHFAVRTGVAVHRGRPPAAAGAPAFWPWSQILDSMTSSLDDQALTAATAGAAKPVAQLSAAVAERLGGAWAPTGDRAETRRFLLYEAVSAFIRQATNGAPVVITLDDLHLADPATLELLSYITSSISDRPIMVLAAYRTLPSDRHEHLEATLATIFREDVAEEIALSGLTRDDIADIVQDLSVGDGHRQEQQRFVDLLHERTGGNPFFVRQLARLMADNTTMMSDGSSTPVPAAVRHVILHRLRRLPENAAQFVDSAAVAGRDFDIRVVAAAAGLDADLAMDACDEAERHALVESTQSGDTSRRFVHALVQEVAVDQLPAGRAARLHAAVAAALAATGTGNHVEMATHMWLARGIVGRDAIPSQLAAAEEAIGVFAYDQAEHHLRRALTLVSENPPVDPTTELTLLLSLFRLIATDRGWGDEDLAGMVLRARELTYSAELTDPVIRLWWSVFLFLLETDDVVSYVEIAATLEKSIREAEPDGSESGSPGDVSTGAVHLMKFFSFLALGTKEQALHELRLARRHIEDAPAQASMAFDENLHVMLYLFEAYWAALTGDAEGHRNAADMARALADADGRPFARAVARTLGAASGTFAGSPGTVAEMAAEALEMDHRFGFSWLATVARSVHHWADALGEGNSDEASEALGTTLESLMSSGRSGSRSSFLLWMADISAATGDRDRARALLLESREHPGPYQQLFVEMVDARLARLT